MKILLEDRFKLNEEQINQIKEMGHSIDDEGKEAVEYWITSSSDCNKDHLLYPNLKYVQLTAAGYNNLDLEALNRRGLKVMNARGVHSPAIAEYILTYILGIYKNTFHYRKLQEQSMWNVDVKHESLKGKRIMFLGAGSIAQETAKILSAFGAHTIGLNSDGRSISDFDQCLVLEKGLKEIEKADVVISTLPSSDSTYHLLNYDVLKKMKASSILMNVGRGDVIDENGLLQAMEETIRFAVLDVFEKEPLPVESDLWNHPKVIITPHLSYSSSNLDLRHGQLLVKQLERLAAGKLPINLISEHKTASK